MREIPLDREPLWPGVEEGDVVVFRHAGRVHALEVVGVQPRSVSVDVPFRGTRWNVPRSSILDVNPTEGGGA